MADPNYGTDLALGPGGFASAMPLATGRRNLLYALYRRWTTNPASTAGRSIYGGKCVDVRAWFAAPLNRGRTASLGQLLIKSGQADERVAAVQAKIQLLPDQRRLGIAVNVTPAQGPSFDLILATDGVSVELLNANAVV